MYTFIIDPSNNNKYNINSKEAKRLLKKYINVIYGGANQEELPKKKKNNSRFTSETAERRFQK